MKQKTWTAIGISFIIGVAIQVYAGDYKDAPDLINMIAVLIGGGLGILIAVIILPTIVSLIMFFKNRQFPHDTFSTMTYIILAFLTIVMLIGESQAMPSIQQDDTEALRQKAKQDCIEGTASVYDMVASVDKKDMKIRAEKYCTCLYDKITKADLKRVLEKKILIPELLNIEYKKQQETCFEANYKGVDVVKFSDLMETESEKKSFWSSKLVSYYIMTYGVFKSEYLLKTLDCFEPSFSRQYSKKISDWEKRDLTATEVFKEIPDIKSKIESCYNKIK